MVQIHQHAIAGDAGGSACHRHGPRGRLQHPPVAHQQRIVEQIAQPRQRRTDGRLAEEQLLPGPGQVLLEHQGFENHQQVHVHAAQVVAVHGGGSQGFEVFSVKHQTWSVRYVS